MPRRRCAVPRRDRRRICVLGLVGFRQAEDRRESFLVQEILDAAQEHEISGRGQVRDQSPHSDRLLQLRVRADRGDRDVRERHGKPRLREKRHRLGFDLNLKIHSTFFDIVKRILREIRDRTGGASHQPIQRRSAPSPREWMASAGVVLRAQRVESHIDGERERPPSCAWTNQNTAKAGRRDAAEHHGRLQ